MTGKELVWLPCTAPRPRQDYRSQDRRRRAAAQRLAPLDCGHRDPWPCRCTEPPLSDRAINGWRDAAQYVMETTGRTPLIPIEVLRALWRRGGEDRAFAEELHSLSNGVVA